MTIFFEKEICDYLNIPAIPKKKWDGTKSFSQGVGVVELVNGDLAYAVTSFDKEKDKAPKIIKVFSLAPFKNIKQGEIYVVPQYMDIDNVEEWDTDEESKKRAEQIIDEVESLENKDNYEAEHKEEELPEWIFPEISNKEEAIAWVSNYRSKNKIKGKIPTSEDSLKAYLYVIYSNNNKKKNKKQ